MRISKSVTLRNSVIDMNDGTITEYVKDDVRTYKLSSILQEWDGVEGVSISIKREDNVPSDDE